MPSWVGKDLITWALYGWILAFFLMDLLADGYWDDAGIWSLVCLAFTGIVLDHPTVQLSQSKKWDLKKNYP